MSRRIVPINYSWTPELAYVVGLFATDGNLSKDGRHLDIKSKDLEQIINVQRCLGMQEKVGQIHRNGHIYYRLTFSNVQWYRWLQSIGLTPNKTHTIGALNIPNQFFRDFLRGHLDGDGTITTYVDHYNTRKHPAYCYVRLMLRFVSASYAHLLWMQSTVEKLLRIDGDLNHSKPRERRVPMWQLKFMKKDSQKLIPWLYYKDDLPTLTRKKQKAQSALANIQSIQRKTYTFQLPIH